MSGKEKKKAGDIKQYCLGLAKRYQILGFWKVAFSDWRSECVSPAS